MTARFSRLVVCALALVGILIGLILLTQLAPQAQAGNNKAPGIIPPQAKYEGKTLGQWNAAWWQWAFAQPGLAGPLYDYTGAKAAMGQSGHVWFLAGVQGIEGTQNDPATVVRNVTIPSGKALFIPILNMETSVYEGTDPDGLWDYIDWGMGLADFMEFTVDGKTLTNDQLLAYGAAAPELFTIKLPADDNLSYTWGLTPDDLPAPVDGVITCEGCAAGGYSVMLAPLSVGQHTIHFAGVFVGDGWTFALDITYNITVKPGKN